MGLAYYDKDSGEALWTGTTTTPAGGDSAYFGMVEGYGLVPAPVIYLEGSESNGNSTLAPDIENLSYEELVNLAKSQTTGVRSDWEKEWHDASYRIAHPSGDKSLMFVSTWDYYVAHRLGAAISRGLGAPSSLSSTHRPQGRPLKSAVDLSKVDHHGRAGNCPPGHYWSWKKRKCIRSKFRRK